MNRILHTTGSCNKNKKNTNITESTNCHPANTKTKTTTNNMRAWTCHGRNQKEMVQRLQQANIIQHSIVAEIMNQVDRKHYVPQEQQQHKNTIDPWKDTPVVTLHGQTISAPHMHAHALELMYPYLQPPSPTTQTQPFTSTTPTMESVKILDVGCGSGYLTACLGRWIQFRNQHWNNSRNNQNLVAHEQSSPPSSTVFGIDIHSDLVEQARQNINRADADLLQSGIVQLQTANGWDGMIQQAPFDIIHVGAAAEHLPEQLAMQLKVGGLLIIPIGSQNGAQTLYKVERIHGDTIPSSLQSVSLSPPTTTTKPKHSTNGKFQPSDYRLTQLLGVRYVPLVDRSPS